MSQAKGLQMTKPIRLVSVATLNDGVLAVDVDGRLWRYGASFKHTEGIGLVQFNTWQLVDGPTTDDLPKEQNEEANTHTDM